MQMQFATQCHHQRCDLCVTDSEQPYDKESEATKVVRYLSALSQPKSKDWFLVAGGALSCSFRTAIKIALVIADVLRKVNVLLCKS
jgi:hypothetical protein